MDDNAIAWIRIFFFQFQALLNASCILVSLLSPRRSCLRQIPLHLRCISWKHFLICRFPYFRYPWTQFSLSNWTVARRIDYLGKLQNNLKAFLIMCYLLDFSIELSTSINSKEPSKWGKSQGCLSRNNETLHFFIGRKVCSDTALCPGSGLCVLFTKRMEFMDHHVYLTAHDIHFYQGQADPASGVIPWQAWKR